MTTVLSTDEVSPAERVDFVRDALSCVRLAPIDFGPAHVPDFRFELRYRDLGALRAHLIDTTTPYLLRRTPALIRRSSADLLTLQVVLSARGTWSQDDRDASLASGDLTMLAVYRPYSIDVQTPGKGLCLTFPRTLLPLRPGQLERLTATPMLADPGIGALTSQLLVQLAAGLDHYSPAEATRISTTALDVLATRIAHELDDDRCVAPEARKRALLTGVFAFIQEHLGDPQLTPGMIAAAHFISLRRLHSLFQEHGLTVASWIRQQRLEGSRRDLINPTLASRPVAGIAARWGFASASHFTQVFKAEYGMPPRDYRKYAHAADHCADPEAPCTCTQGHSSRPD